MSSCQHTAYHKCEFIWLIRAGLLDYTGCYGVKPNGVLVSASDCVAALRENDIGGYSWKGSTVNDVKINIILVLSI